MNPNNLTEKEKQALVYKITDTFLDMCIYTKQDQKPKILIFELERDTRLRPSAHNLKAGLYCTQVPEMNLSVPFLNGERLTYENLAQAKDPSATLTTTPYLVKEHEVSVHEVACAVLISDLQRAMHHNNSQEDEHLKEQVAFLMTKVVPEFDK